MKIRDLANILNSEDKQDILLGIEIYKTLNLPKRHKRILVQYLVESKKWRTSTNYRQYQIVYRRGWDFHDVIEIGPMNNL